MLILTGSEVLSEDTHLGIIAINNAGSIADDEFFRLCFDCMGRMYDEFDGFE